jgi:glycosyltransferase involved in cell wall biosynthesis
MKLLFATDGIYPHSVGGMQRHSRLLLEALAATGEVEITVLHPHPGHIIFPGHPNITEVPLPPLPGKKHYFRELKDYSRRVLQEALQRPDHLIYSQGLSVWVGADQLKHRLIINPHGLEPFQAIGLKDRLKTWPYRRVFRHLFRKATRVISLGGRLTPILQQAGRPENVIVIPNATQPLTLPPDQLVKTPGSPLKFLFVGRFAYNKGINILLEATHQLLPPQTLPLTACPFTLTLAGKGPLFDQMQARYAHPAIHFHGFMEDAQLDQAYLENHVFVFPTLFEGMPTAILEAMARAMPIIVTDTGATLELVDETNGIIIPKNDPQALAKAMQTMLQMPPNHFQSLSRSSLQKFHARFTWQAVAQSHLDLFKSLNPK